jgi:hypothetical protein
MTTDEMRRLSSAIETLSSHATTTRSSIRSFGDCFLDTKPLGPRSEGREAVRRTYEAIYFDLATLCDQAGFPLDEIRESARQRSGT